jgi:hypothetical protein
MASPYVKDLTLIVFGKTEKRQTLEKQRLPVDD